MIKGLLLGAIVLAAPTDIFTSQKVYTKGEGGIATAKITLSAAPGWKFNDQYPFSLRGYRNKIHPSNKVDGSASFMALPRNSGVDFTFRLAAEQFKLTDDKLYVKVNFSFCSETACKVWRDQVFEFTPKDLK